MESNIQLIQKLQNSHMDEIKKVQQGNLAEIEKAYLKKDDEISRLKKSQADELALWRTKVDEKVEKGLVFREKELIEQFKMERDEQIQVIIGNLSEDQSKLIEEMNKK